MRSKEAEGVNSMLRVVVGADPYDTTPSPQGEGFWALNEGSLKDFHLKRKAKTKRTVSADTVLSFYRHFINGNRRVTLNKSPSIES